MEPRTLHTLFSGAAHSLYTCVGTWCFGPHGRWVCCSNSNDSMHRKQHCKLYGLLGNTVLTSTASVSIQFIRRLEKSTTEPHYVLAAFVADTYQLRRVVIYCRSAVRLHYRFRSPFQDVACAMPYCAYVWQSNNPRAGNAR